MTCTATTRVTLPKHPTTGAVTELVHCSRETQCVDERHLGWIQAGWLPATTVEWSDPDHGHVEIVGSRPGEGTIDFILHPVEPS